MRSRKTGIALAVLGLGAAIVLFIALRSDNETAVTTTRQTQSGGDQQPGQPRPKVPTIVVRNGEPLGGVQEFRVAGGGLIRFKVKSDVADEVHLHGYDISKPVTSGGEVGFAVPAAIQGVFEVELENAAVPLAEITVSPG